MKNLFLTVFYTILSVFMNYASGGINSQKITINQYDAQNTQLSILAITPNQNALNISTNTIIEITFSEDINPMTLSNSTVKLNGSLGVQYAATFSYSSSIKKVTINPIVPFMVGEVETVILTQGIKSVSGDSLAKSYSWSFTIKCKAGAGGKFIQNSMPSVADGPSTVVSGDWDGDRYPDLAVLQQAPGVSGFTLLKNSGTGDFTTIYNKNPVLGGNGWYSGPWGLVFSDLNSDLKSDIAIVNENTSDVSVLLNQGSYDLNSTIYCPAGFSPHSLVANDFTGDGNNDLAVCDIRGDVTILSNNGDGSFTPTSTVSAGGSLYSAISGDFDRDGDADIAVVNQGSNYVRILLNDGTGTFLLNSSVVVGNDPYSISAGDFDNDGHIDLVVANNGSNTVSILKNNGNGTFNQTSVQNVGNNPRSVTTGDFNGDGNIDLAVANYGSNTVSILLNSGNGEFSQSSVIDVGSYPNSITTSDYNGDGCLDLAVANSGSNNISVLINTNTSVTDTEGNVYKTVKIGNQIWMSENLKATKYNDGTAIPNITDNNGWLALTSHAYCWYDNDETSYKNVYGALYNWHAVNTGKLCPVGWHVPDDIEWKKLEMYLGMTQAQADSIGWRGTDVSSKLKTTTGWCYDGNGTNSSGFSALPAGIRPTWPGFAGIDGVGVWWSSTEYDNSSAYQRGLYGNVPTAEMNNTKVCRVPDQKINGFSIRCIRDLENNPPSANAGPDQTVFEGTLVTLNGSGSSDPEGDALTYHWTAPAGIILTNATSATPTFTAPEVTTDTPYTFILIVNDGTSSSEPDQVVVTVRNFESGNHFTTVWTGNGIDQMNINAVTAKTGDTNLGAGDEIAAYDGSLCVGVVKLTQPIVLTTPSTFGLIKVSKAEDGQQNGYTPGHAILFRIWDQSQQKELLANQVTFLNPQNGQPISPVPYTIGGTAYVKVNWANTAPIANAGPDQTVNEGTPVTLSGSASSDAEGDPLSYLWSAPQGITLNSAMVVNPTFTAPEVMTDQTYTFSLVVNDGTVNSTSDQVIITVKQVNKPPVANAGPDQNVDEGISVTLNGAASSDPDGDPLTYLWSAPSGIILSSASVPNPTFTAPEVTTDQTYTITLVVHDGKINSVADQVIVNVKQVNKPPVANAGPDQTVNEGATVTLNGSASTDPDSDPLTFTWSAPAGILLTDVHAARPVFTAPAVTQNTVFTFSLTVNDGQVDSPADQVAVTVKLIPKHFKTIWTGNGTDHMQVSIYGATLDGTALEAGDEIGLFDGDLCVGAGILSGPLSTGNVLLILASANDGSGNGYTDGHAIKYLVYDKSGDKEITAITAVYSTSNPAWSNDGKYHIGATAFAELTALSTIKLTLQLQAGWNIFSVNSIPSNPDMMAIFQPLITSGCLIKVQDEQGNSLEDFGVFGGWTNNIGNISVNEGYKVKLANDCQLNFEGVPVAFPITIPLVAGWNIISFPGLTEANGMAVIQQLINRGTLVKVQDESGNAIEDWGVFGGWQNYIGNFKPGEGYKIKVTANETLTIYEFYTKSSSSPLSHATPVYFKPVTQGNGVDHMNINLVDIPLVIQPGDEIGVFDGDLCVGSVVIGNRYSVIGEKSEIRNQKSQITNISIPISASDGSGLNGFTEGNTFTLKIWKAKANREYQVEPEILQGTSTFLKHESTLVSLAKFATTGLGDIVIPDKVDLKIYPNPTDGKILISAVNASLIGSKVRVMNSTGQIVMNMIVNTEPGIIDLSGNVHGIYYLKVIHDTGTKTEKIIFR